MKETIDKLNSIKAKNYPSKDTLKKMKREARDWEKILQCTHLIEDLCSQFIKNT